MELVSSGDELARLRSETVLPLLGVSQPAGGEVGRLANS